MRSSVDGDALDVALLIAQLGSREAQRATVGQSDGTLTEERRDQFVASTQGIYGIEAQGSEDVPSGHLTAVLVATEAIGLVGVELTEDTVREVGGLPRLARGVIEEDDVMPWLIAVGILPDHPRGEDGQFNMLRCGGGEELIQSLGELSLHQLAEALDIVLYAEEVMIGITLGEGLRVGKGIEEGIQPSIALTRAEEARTLIPEMAVGAGTLPVDLLDFAVAHPCCIASNSIVIVGIFEGLRDALLLVIATDVALLPILVQTSVSLTFGR